MAGLFLKSRCSEFLASWIRAKQCVVTHRQYKIPRRSVRPPQQEYPIIDRPLAGILARTVISCSIVPYLNKATPVSPSFCDFPISHDGAVSLARRRGIWLGDRFRS